MSTATIRLKRDEFLQRLESVQAGLSHKEIVEQSSCFVFRDGIVQTYNDEVACRQKVQVDFTGAVQAAPLLAILRKLTEDEIEIEPADKELLIIGKKRKAGITMEHDILLPVDKYLEEPDEWKKLHEDFEDAVNIVQQCASTDESKFVATCVHLHPKWIEAFDNYQVTRYKMKTGISTKTLIKRDSIKNIVSLGMTKFSESPNWIHFKNASGLIMSCRRHLDDFPDLGQVLDFSGTPTTLPKGLSEAAEKAEIFSSQNADDNQVTVELRPGKLRIKGIGVSGWYSEVKNIKYEGETLSFLIAPKLLMELCSRHNECEIASDRLKVDGGKFVYVTSLGVEA